MVTRSGVGAAGSSTWGSPTTPADEPPNTDAQANVGSYGSKQVGPSRIRGIEGCWHRLGHYVTRMPRASKLRGLVKPWALRRRGDYIDG